jgi:hypothetical protein
MNFRSALFLLIFGVVQGCTSFFESPTGSRNPKKDSVDSEIPAVKFKSIIGKWVCVDVPRTNRSISGTPTPTRYEFADSSYKKYSGYFFLACGNCTLHPDAGVIWYKRNEVGKYSIQSDSIYFSEVYDVQYSNDSDTSTITEKVSSSEYRIAYSISESNDSLRFSSTMITSIRGIWPNYDTLFTRDSR